MSQIAELLMSKGKFQGDGASAMSRTCAPSARSHCAHASRFVRAAERMVAPTATSFRAHADHEQVHGLVKLGSA
jgi:hypothetical protein